MFMLALWAALIGVGVSTPVPKGLSDVRIVGGEDIDITEAPYQVSIVTRGRHMCGGTIIANDLIVTAAHCVLGTSPYEYQVRVGSSSSQNGGELYPVGDLVWHPGFNYNKMDSDIAILWLKKPLKFNERVAPVAMYNQGEEIMDGEATMVTGWGNIREGGGYPSTLQMVLIPKVNTAVCERAYSTLYRITQNMLCAGIPEGGKDACQGDSGGPLVHNGRLAGVVSWGLGCARPNYPGVYAKISALRSWIDYQSTKLRIKHVLRL
ncbi:vitellin-degrading protease-like [Epargyreus clarus]|uniref:vitellin-degrading protease-like n=1 Tax=Epargyreus clarus TaxID=520877 RepID=UPI003C2E63F4